MKSQVGAREVRQGEARGEHWKKRGTHRTSVKPQQSVALCHPEPHEKGQADQVQDGLEGGIHQHDEEECIRLAYGLGQVLLRPLIQRLRKGSRERAAGEKEISVP
jgi:hypothetical protein